MEKKEETPQRIVRRVYETKHKEERKTKHAVWGTSIERELFDEINLYLKENRITKVELIKAGFEALQREYGPKKIE